MNKERILPGIHVEMIGLCVGCSFFLSFFLSLFIYLFIFAVLIAVLSEETLEAWKLERIRKGKSGYGLRCQRKNGSILYRTML